MRGLSITLDHLTGFPAKPPLFETKIEEKRTSIINLIIEVILLLQTFLYSFCGFFKKEELSCWI